MRKAISFPSFSATCSDRKDKVIVLEGLAESLASFFGSWLTPELATFLVSLLPILELRGGLIASALLGVDWFVAFPISVIGNFLPIPFILIFIQKIFKFIKRTNFLKMRRLVEKLDEKAEKKSKGLETASFWGLFILVAIPLPGTGGWTGALVASFLKMDIKKASIIIFLGILAAGLITSTFTYLIPSLF